MIQSLERMLFPQRVRSNGDVVPKGSRARFYQWLFERGLSVPWIYTPAQCAKFWDVPAGRNDIANRPEDYAFGPTGIMKYVLDLIGPWVNRDTSVLEIGCNAGSKLEKLRKAGFADLSGIEMNPACVDVMRAAFPELHAVTSLHLGPAERLLPGLPVDRFGFVYSISSICCIHPAHHHLFDHIARICSGHLLTLEIEWAAGRYFFPRNYRRIFEARGFSQVGSVLLSRDVCPEPELNAYWGHVMRLFVKNGRAQPHEQKAVQAPRLVASAIL